MVGDDRVEHVVVRSATQPFVAPTLTEPVRRLFSGSVVSVVLDDAPGETTIACEGREDSVVFAAAAAAATVKRAWGWDGSPSITVRLHPGGESVSVDPVSDGGAWSVREIVG